MRPFLLLLFGLRTCALRAQSINASLTDRITDPTKALIAAAKILFDHPNFANPTNSITSTLFGRSTQTLANGLGTGGAIGGFNPLYQVGGPRSIQLALRLQF